MPTHNHSYTPKPREEYIAMCRYYKGSDSISLENKMFAGYEKMWVEMHYHDYGIKSLKDLVKDYKLHGLGHFSSDDGVSIAFKALLWNRYMHWGCGVENTETFKEWYNRFYLKK